MFFNFKQILQEVSRSSQQKNIAVAAAEDTDVLQAIKMAQEANIGGAILVGDTEKIKRAAEEIEFDISKLQLIEEKDKSRAAKKAVIAVKAGQADIIMKGLLGTADFLRAILDKDCGLRGAGVLSHVAVFEIPRFNRLLLAADCAMNVAPGLAEKTEIIQNTLQVSRVLGIAEAKVAAVCAVETVNKDMSATLDAAALAKMSERGQIKGVVIDGPLALDNAISEKAARHKGISSPVAGQADILLLPDIEAGNVLYKALVYLAGAQNAGVIMGATAPIVLTSRADSPEAKLNSIALSLLVSQWKTAA